MFSRSRQRFWGQHLAAVASFLRPGSLTMFAAPATRTLLAFGRTGQRVARNAGALGLLVWGTARAIVCGRVSLAACLEQAYEIGVSSVPLVFTVAVLGGVVTAQQGGYQFTGAIPLYILGSIVTSTIVLELGPILTGFVMIGRVGARITAEIGTMRVSEQIDALESLGRDPVGFLAAPRILGGALAVPALVAIADLTGVLAGMFAARSTLHLGPEAFFYGARLYWHNWDLFYSLLKGLTFGFIIPLISVHMGFGAAGGAEGVGRATNGSVVFMTVSMLVLDALFPPILLG